MTSKEKLELLHELQAHVESKAFQELVMKPLFSELDSLKNAYDCESLRELNTLKGKKQGIVFLLNLLKQNDQERKNIRYRLEDSSEASE